MNLAALDELSGLNTTLDERRTELAQAEADERTAVAAIHDIQARIRMIDRNQTLTLDERRTQRLALEAQGQQQMRLKNAHEWRVRELKSRVQAWVARYDQASVNVHNSQNGLAHETRKLAELETQIRFQQGVVAREQHELDKATAAQGDAVAAAVGNVPKFRPPASVQHYLGIASYFDVDNQPVAQDGSPLLVTLPNKPVVRITKQQQDELTMAHNQRVLNDALA